MQRYFVREIDSYGNCVLSKEDSYHVTKVMRMSIGQSLEIVSSSREYIAKITSLIPTVCCQIQEEKEEKEKTIPNIVIAQALVKEQKMDYILQKATELGVYQVIPFVAERSIIKVNSASQKVERWRKIVKEASEQSKRSDIPIVDEITDLKKIDLKKYTHKWICSVNEKSKTMKSVLSNVSISDTILCVIGPEGGLSFKEEDYLLSQGFEAISLGDRVLRTETASLFVLSATNYEFMR